MREPGRLLLLGFLSARRLGPLLRQGLAGIGSSAGVQLNGLLLALLEQADTRSMRRCMEEGLGPLLPNSVPL